MEKFRCWMEKNKQLCVLTGIIGMLLAPFLWPFFLAIIFNSLTLAVPVLLGYLLVKQPWKREKGGYENEKCQEQAKEKQGTHAAPKDLEAASDKEDMEAQSVSKTKDQEPVKTESNKNTKAEKEVQAGKEICWYHVEGKERIFRLKDKLSREGITEFSVSKEGICTVREEKRFRRIGVIKSFPWKEIMNMKQELKADGIRIRKAGEYIWLSWGKEALH